MIKLQYFIPKWQLLLIGISMILVGQFPEETSMWRQHLRHLTHKCGFKANWCCSSSLSQCLICTDNCLAGDTRLVNPNKFSGLSCNTAETCTESNSGDRPDCSMSGVAIPASPLTQNVNTGSYPISTSWEAIFSGAETRCLFDDCTLNLQSGVD